MIYSKILSVYSYAGYTYFGLRLQLYDGYISINRQKGYFDEKFELVKQNRPELTLEEAFVETTISASPIRNLDGTDNIPPHSTGAAVDVGIVNQEFKS